VPGSVPRQSPPKATGGRTPRLIARRRGRTTTGRTKKPKQQQLNVMHWNAEGLFNKKAELEHTLHERNIHICCIQETHLQEAKSFKVRGFQCFRCDRIGISKGGILTLGRNNIGATQTRMHMNDSEFQVLCLRLGDRVMHVVNIYSPNDRALSLDTIDPEDTNYLVVGDFNSHSQSWGYDNMDRRGEEVET